MNDNVAQLGDGVLQKSPIVPLIIELHPDLGYGGGVGIITSGEIVGESVGIVRYQGQEVWVSRTITHIPVRACVPWSMVTYNNGLTPGHTMAAHTNIHTFHTWLSWATLALFWVRPSMEFCAFSSCSAASTSAACSSEHLLAMAATTRAELTG